MYDKRSISCSITKTLRQYSYTRDALILLLIHCAITNVVSGKPSVSKTDTKFTRGGSGAYHFPPKVTGVVIVPPDTVGFGEYVYYEGNLTRSQCSNCYPANCPEPCLTCCCDVNRDQRTVCNTVSCRQCCSQNLWECPDPVDPYPPYYPVNPWPYGSPGCTQDFSGGIAINVAPVTLNCNCSSDAQSDVNYTCQNSPLYGGNPSAYTEANNCTFYIDAMQNTSCVLSCTVSTVACQQGCAEACALPCAQLTEDPVPCTTCLEECFASCNNTYQTCRVDTCSQSSGPFASASPTRPDAANSAVAPEEDILDMSQDVSLDKIGNSDLDSTPLKPSQLATR